MEYFLDKGGLKGISLPGTLLNNYKGKKVAFYTSCGHIFRQLFVVKWTIFVDLYGITTIKLNRKSSPKDNLWNFIGYGTKIAY